MKTFEVKKKKKKRKKCMNTNIGEQQESDK
jgi:hypothetical protein